MALLEIDHLKKYFPSPRGMVHAVDDVSFSIEKGETMGLVGESGCGKSTLGRTIIHLLESTGGHIRFEGEDVTHLDRKRLAKVREDMQIIFQDPYSSLNPRLTLQDTVMEPLKLSGRFKKEELESETARLMELVGLEKRFWLSYPHELDGGRRQRVGIARAIALNPKFVVCDEPVSALDVSIQAQILNLLMDLQDKYGLTYLFVTHDLSVVRHIQKTLVLCTWDRWWKPDQPKSFLSIRSILIQKRCFRRSLRWIFIIKSSGSWSRVKSIPLLILNQVAVSP